MVVFQFFDVIYTREGTVTLQRKFSEWDAIFQTLQRAGSQRTILHLSPDIPNSLQLNNLPMHASQLIIY
jgi:hypothetical protein